MRIIVAHVNHELPGGADHPLAPKRITAVQSGLLDKIEYFARIEVASAVGVAPESQDQCDQVLQRLARPRSSRRSLAALAGPACETAHDEDAGFQNRPITLPRIHARFRLT